MSHGAISVVRPFAMYEKVLYAFTLRVEDLVCLELQYHLSYVLPVRYGM